MSTKAILKLTPGELHSKSRELAKKLLELRLKKGMGQLKAPSDFGKIRREKACVLTVLASKNVKSIRK